MFRCHLDIASMGRPLRKCVGTVLLAGVALFAFVLVPSAPSLATTDNIHPACFGTSYDPNNFNWLSYQNQCGSYPITITTCTPRGGCGTIENLPNGKTGSTGESKTEIDDQGGYKTFACRGGYHAVATDGVSAVRFTTSAYRCVDI
jgi:hypothetical protein